MNENANAGKRVTLDDVAREAGVSRSTASRALNRDPVVNQETAQRVAASAERLQYLPNVSARALSGGLSDLVCMVVPSFSQTRLAVDYYARLISGVEETANAFGVHVIIKNKTESDSISDLIETRRALGFIVRIGHNQREELKLIRHLKRQKTPFILIGHAREKWMEELSVMIDSVGGARRVAHHLADRGFSRLLFISGPPRNMESRDRHYGFRLGLHEKGYTDSAIAYAQGDYTPQSGFQAAQEHLQNERIDAVFACNDHMALGVLTFCASRGIRVPEDVAVVGFDDEDYAAYTWPSLTTVRQPIYELGEQAVRQLATYWHGRAIRRSGIILSPTLIVRQSTAGGGTHSGSVSQTDPSSPDSVQGY